MSAFDATRGKLFTQVVRTTKANEADLMDPLSMFAMQDAMQKDEDTTPAPSVTASTKAPPLSNSLKDELRTPSLNSLHKKNDSRSSVGSTSPAPKTRPTASASVPVAAPKSQLTAPTSTKPQLAASTAQPAGAEEEILLKSLTGEQKIMSMLDTFVTVATGEVLSGALFMTNYRIVFIPSINDLTSISITNPSIHSYFQVPIAAIDKIDREKKTKDVYNSAFTIVIHCKDFRQLRLTIRSNGSKTGSGEYDIDRAINLISAYAFPNNMRYLFAFNHKLSGVQSRDLAEPYDAALEFSRMGVLDNPYWRVSNANATYQLCNTYPQWLVVPASISDDELSIIAAFRSGHRLPAMCWADRESGATMWRSSQPKAGVSGTCSQDERMLDQIARSRVELNRIKRASGDSRRNGPEGILNIIDCRSRASAMANRAAGAGYESQTNYPSSRLEFYGISNIHAVRDMYKNLGSFILNSSPSSSVDLTFTKQFEDTQWPNAIRSILKASHDTAIALNNGTPVLVHCSHGWDRTAQVCALAQLLLDPYYRTFEGFKVLVEKEWISFGHAFQMRCAHSQDKTARAEDQVSQVMIQFLDCVWQIHRQHLQYFEFNARYILVVADHIYSGRFGTFLLSSDYERDIYNARQQCPDIWTYLNCNRNVLSNPLFTNPDRVLLPPVSQLLRGVTIWADYFLRWSAVPTVAPIPLQLSQHLYTDGLCRPLEKDELHEQPYNPVDSNGNPLSHYADFEVNAAITSADCWEAAFRAERMKRIIVEVRKQKQIEQQQDTIARLTALLRKHAVDLDEEAITAALKPTSRVTTCTEPNVSAEEADATPESELDTGSLDPTSTETSLPHIDPLGGTPITSRATITPVASANSSSVPNGDIVINEKFQDLFVAQPPKVPSNHSLEGTSPVPVHESSSLAVDDADFYPEDEAECLPDDDYDAAEEALAKSGEDEEYGISV